MNGGIAELVESPTTPRLSVVVADDAPELRALLRRMLDMNGFEVVGEAADGAEAVVLADSRQPDILLLDLAMPVMDGLEAIPRIRALAPSTKIVVLSGFDAMRMAEEALSLGADAYLEKGVGNVPESLSTTLRSVCGGGLTRTDPPLGEGGREESLPYLRVDVERIWSSLENAPMGIAVTAADGFFLRTNQALCDLLGRTQAQLLGNDVRWVLHPQDLQEDRMRTGALLAGRTTACRLEQRYRRGDGTSVWVECNVWLPTDRRGQPLYVDSRGQSLYLIRQFMDISERKHVERAMASLTAQLEERNTSLESTNLELERSNEELGEFASVASHDLAEPLRVIGGFAQLLAEREGHEADPETKMFLDYILRGVDRMQRLITDLLAYSRVGTAAISLVSVDLRHVVDEALAALSFTIDESCAQVMVGPLPTVVADATQLAQLFQNLIGNAVKFTAPDRQPQVRIAAERRQGTWIVSVADNGIGIDPEHRERVFKMFNRLHGRDEYPGTGIGLAVCQKIVERRGGRIWVEDAEPGCRFLFTIPDRTDHHQGHEEDG